MKDTKKIIQGCLRNERKAQFQLYDHVFNYMMSICIRYEPDQEKAIEVLNNAFMKIITNLSSYEMRYPLLPWVKRITVNEAIDHYRKESRRLQVVSNEDLSESNESGAMADEDDWVENEFLDHMLQSLKEEERAVFNLYVVDGYSHKEIAEMLEMSERSSIRHLGNARKKLQEMLHQMRMRKV